MDPVSHAAFGRMLIAFDDRRRLGPAASAACILGSLAPDLDLARTMQGCDVYLRAHQAGTHALVGAVACGALTATVVRAAARGSRWASLFAAATAGAVGHLALDWLAGATIRLLWPWWSGAGRLPLFAMADPWLMALFLVALLLLWRQRRPAVSAGLLLVLVCMCAVKAGLYLRAVRVDRRAVPASEATHAEAAFGSWRRWTFFHVRGDSAERWQVDAIGGRAAQAFRIDRGLGLSGVAASRSLPTVANLLDSHAITFARVRPAAGGRYEVTWSDLRYCAAAVESEPVCGLWFGGEYEAGGRAIDAVVHLGTFVQRRRVAAPATDHE